ncbi:hypothetical protein GCM10023350_33430 [Nocardioides endophyticus]|uniref:Uncharacterized protein n=1 Tax=Nocardioides endophyticus TaxID=1353775 RepID=A0ABP8Z439_9ACTN
MDGITCVRSLEGDLEITAHYKRLVRLRIALRGDPYRSDWRVSATVEIGSGGAVVGGRN